jgi:hypothetical protein
MAAARRLRLRAVAGEAVVWFARAARRMPGAASGQEPTAPAADRRVREVSPQEAPACRQRMAAESRARSFAAAASARRWAAPVALAAEVAQPSEQPAAWDAAAAEAGVAVAQRDAVAAPRSEAAVRAGVAVQQPEAAGQVGAAVPRPEAAGRAGVAVRQLAAPCVREEAPPSAAAWAPPYLQAQRLARLPRVRSARAMKYLQIAAR